MRSQTNIISFKSSKTVSGRPRLKAVPPPPAENQRTATSRSPARLLITVVVTIRTESDAIVITGLHTVDMVSAISTQRYIVYVGLFVWDVYILVGVSILSSLFLPMIMKKSLDVGRKQRVKKYFLRRVTKKVLTPPWLLYCALCFYLCSSKLKVYRVTFNGIYKPLRVEWNIWRRVNKPVCSLCWNL